MDWRKAVGAVAPTLLRAIGGPFGGVAANALGAVLGVDATDETALEAKVTAMTAADLLALKNAEQQFQKDMRALGIDEAKVDAADRASARAREVALKDHVPFVLAVLVHVAFFWVLWALVSKVIPGENRETFTILLGILSTGMASCWSYYWGSSASSRSKDGVIGDALSKR